MNSSAGIVNEVTSECKFKTMQFLTISRLYYDLRLDFTVLVSLSVYLELLIQLLLNPLCYMH